MWESLSEVLALRRQHAVQDRLHHRVRDAAATVQLLTDTAHCVEQLKWLIVLCSVAQLRLIHKS